MCQSTQFTYLEHSDRRLAWWHIAFLLVVGLLPFSTAFLTTHFPLRGAVLVYWANLLLVGAGSADVSFTGDSVRVAVAASRRGRSTRSAGRAAQHLSIVWATGR